MSPIDLDDSEYSETAPRPRVDHPLLDDLESLLSEVRGLRATRDSLIRDLGEIAKTAGALEMTSSSVLERVMKLRQIEVCTVEQFRQELDAAVSSARAEDASLAEKMMAQILHQNSEIDRLQHELAFLPTPREVVVRAFGEFRRRLAVAIGGVR